MNRSTRPFMLVLLLPSLALAGENDEQPYDITRQTSEAYSNAEIHEKYTAEVYIGSSSKDTMVVSHVATIDRLTNLKKIESYQGYAISNVLARSVPVITPEKESYQSCAKPKVVEEKTLVPLPELVFLELKRQWSESQLQQQRKEQQEELERKIAAESVLIKKNPKIKSRRKNKKRR